MLMLINTFRIQLILTAGLLFAPILLYAQTDDPNLINITNLERLHAMRYDLDGDGIPMLLHVFDYNAAFGTSFGVADADNDNAVNNSATITGYELTRNLDFEAGASYAGSRNLAWIDPANGGTTSTAGWEPIGDNSTPFRATFEGNDNTISNLYIDRPSTPRAGLFGVVDTGGKIKNLGLVGGSVEGSTAVGCLAGRNEGTISACYATGDATSPSGVCRRSCGAEHWRNKWQLCHR